MDYSSRLSLIRARATTLGLLKFATFQGFLPPSHSEVAEEWGRLGVNQSAPATLTESTQDDSSEDAFPSSFSLAARRTGELETEDGAQSEETA